MKNSFDVIIIGAGPGGLACAQTLLKSDLSILILEKSRIPVKKNCGGGVTSLVRSFFIPDEICRTFKEIIVRIGDSISRVKFKEPMRIVSREDLSEFQLSEIRKENVQVNFEEKALKIEENRIVTDKSEYSFNYLVGADGANSIVADHLGFKPELTVVINTDIEEISEEPMWFVDSKVLGTGYFWIFPHRKFTSLGVYISNGTIPVEDSKRFLREKIKEYGFSSSVQIKSGVVNTGFRGVVFKNIFLVGEAAGLTLKTTGEGIPGAVISGREVAEKIIDSNYRMPELKKYITLKKRREAAGMILEKLPFIRNFMFKLFLKYKTITNSQLINKIFK